MRGFVLIIAVLVSSCDQSDSRICGSSLAARFPAGAIVKTADDQMQVTASCVERWAARLALAPDPADHVVQAVLGGGCGEAISYLESMKAKEQPGSEMTSEQAAEYWRQRAIFIVVQTRAGNCYPDA